MKGEGGQAQGEVKEMVVSVCKALPRNAITPNSLEGSKKRPDTYFERCTEEKKDVKKKSQQKILHLPVLQPSASGCCWQRILGQVTLALKLYGSALLHICPFVLYSCWVKQYTQAVGFWDGSNVLFLYTLMNKNWIVFKSSSSPTVRAAAQAQEGL